MYDVLHVIRAVSEDEWGGLNDVQATPALDIYDSKNVLRVVGATRMHHMNCPCIYEIALKLFFVGVCAVVCMCMHVGIILTSYEPRC